MRNNCTVYFFCFFVKRKLSRRIYQKQRKDKTMNKMKIAGIIISIVAAVAFVLLYFGRPHTVINAILVLLAGGVAVLGLMMVSVVEEINLEDTNDEK